MKKRKATLLTLALFTLQLLFPAVSAVAGGEAHPDVGMPVTLAAFPVSVLPSDGGQVSVSNASPEEGELVLITVTAHEGYEFGQLVITEAGGDEIEPLANGNDTFSFPFGGTSVTIIGEFYEILDDNPIPTAPGQFIDVSESDWFYDDVYFVADNGLFNGTSDFLFSPQRSLTRGMLVTALWRLEGRPEAEAACPFADLTQEWYNEAISWAYEQKIVNGYSDSTFAPDKAVTREEMATMLYRHIQYQGGGFEGSWMFLLDFDDSADVSEWANEAVCYGSMSGYIAGKPGHKFAPRATATRAEAAAVLHRLETL